MGLIAIPFRSEVGQEVKIVEGGTMSKLMRGGMGGDRRGTFTFFGAVRDFGPRYKGAS